MAGLPRKSRQKVRKRGGFSSSAADAANCSAADADMAASTNGSVQAGARAADPAAARAKAVDKFGSNGHAWHGQKVCQRYARMLCIGQARLSQGAEIQRS